MTTCSSVLVLVAMILQILSPLVAAASSPGMPTSMPSTHPPSISTPIPILEGPMSRGGALCSHPIDHHPTNYPSVSGQPTASPTIFAEGIPAAGSGQQPTASPAFFALPTSMHSGGLLQISAADFTMTRSGPSSLHPISSRTISSAPSAQPTASPTLLTTPATMHSGGHPSVFRAAPTGHPSTNTGLPTLTQAGEWTTDWPSGSPKTAEAPTSQPSTSHPNGSKQTAMNAGEQACDVPTHASASPTSQPSSLMRGGCTSDVIVDMSASQPSQSPSIDDEQTYNSHAAPTDQPSSRTGGRTSHAPLSTLAAPTSQPSKSNPTSFKAGGNYEKPTSSNAWEWTGRVPDKVSAAPTGQPGVSLSNNGYPTSLNAGEWTSHAKVEASAARTGRCSASLSNDCHPTSLKESNVPVSMPAAPTFQPSTRNPTSLEARGLTSGMTIDISTAPAAQPSTSMWNDANPSSLKAGEWADTLPVATSSPTSQPSMSALNDGRSASSLAGEWTSNVPFDMSAASTSQPSATPWNDELALFKARETTSDVPLDTSEAPTGRPGMGAPTLSKAIGWTGHASVGSAAPTSQPIAGEPTLSKAFAAPASQPSTSPTIASEPMSVKPREWTVDVPFDMSAAPTSQPSTSPSIGGVPTPPKAGEWTSDAAFDMLAEFPCLPSAALRNDGPTSLKAGESTSEASFRSSAAPTCQPSTGASTPTKAGGWIAHSSAGALAELSGPPSISLPNTSKPMPWTNGGFAGRAHPDTLCALPTQARGACFVSAFKRTNTRRATNLPPVAFLLRGTAARRKELASSFHLKSSEPIGDMELTNHLLNEPEQSPGGSEGVKLIPLLMYSVVPFLPSLLLTTLNDDYLAIKAQFNAASAALPANLARDSAEYLSASSLYNDSMQKLFVLLLSKRVALYFLATAAMTYAGWRASMTVAAIRDGGMSGPGDALDRLNEEVLEGKGFLELDGDQGAESEEDEEDDDSDLFAKLVDQNPQSSNAGNALAVALPLVLAASLGISYLAVVSSGTSGDEQYPVTMLPEMVTASLPYLTSIPSAALCLLFMAAEFRWAIPENTRPGAGDQSSSESTTADKLLRVGNVLALAYVVGAYVAKINPTLSLGEMKLDMWPLQNGVNIALATAVSRALSPFFIPTDSSSPAKSKKSKSILTVALALLGLTLFDAVSTFGTVANAASAPDAADATRQSMSVMETVARSRLADSSSTDVASPLAYVWQPGLLEIILGHDSSKATEALGVGDVVFPSILVAWAFAADNFDEDAGTVEDDEASDTGIESAPTESGGRPYATASVAGYLLGSLATELVGSFSLLGPRSGLPALVFLVPSMLGVVTATAWSRNELGDVWGFAPVDDKNDGGDDGGSAGGGV